MAMKQHARWFCAAAGLVLGAQAWGQTTTWTLSTATVSSGNYVASGVGGTPNAPPSATASAWANTGSGNDTGGGTLERQSATANFVQYSGGVGINNLDGCSSGTTCDVGDLANTQPEHAIDNQQRYEMVLLNFAAPVNLTKATTGWTGTDADFTVLAYSPGGSSAPSLAGQTWSALTVASGWNLIGNYSFSPNRTSGSETVTFANSTYSSSWLIGALNPLVSSNVGKLGLDTSSDYFKLISVFGCSAANCPSQTGGAPEPGSIALLASALVGMFGVSRRRKT